MDTEKGLYVKEKKRADMHLFSEKKQNNFKFSRTGYAAALVILLGAGICYRLIAGKLRVYAETSILLPVSFVNFPRQIGDWRGEDVNLPENVLRISGNDEYINRLYYNDKLRLWSNLYVAYSARPRTMVGHRPEACYVGGGWVHDETRETEIISGLGVRIPCLIHRFHKPSPSDESIIVLNFYIVNGKTSNQESGFSGVGWRTPNIAGNPARYVAQVQISSVFEDSIRKAGRDMVDTILDFLPDANGKVRATDYIKPASDTIE